ncbi:MAG: glycoside hydrolase family 4 [Planctomycetota bacterium]
MQKPKVVLVGAGSLFFGRNAIWQMVHAEALRGGTLALVDTDAGRLDKMRRLAERVVAHHDASLKVEASVDRRDVLPGADFVILSFADRNAHFRGVDCETSLRYGIRMCSGDTIGPGGVFRTLREWPEIARCARDVMDTCPDAWVLNYINPTATNGIGLRRFFPGLKSIALCDAQFGLTRRYAELAGVDEDDPGLVIRSAGPNHFTWLLECTHNGRDLTPDILAQLRERATDDLNEQAQGKVSQAKGYMNNGIAAELYDAFGVLPTVLGHTKEYVRFYQHPGYAGRDAHPPLKIFEVPARLAWTQRVWDRVDAYLAGTDGGGVAIGEFDDELREDPATELVERMWTGNGGPMFVNTMNGGAVPNLADDAFLELLCDVDMEGVRPRSCPAMPRGVRGLCEQVLDTHELTAAAAHHADRGLLRRALLTDPLTSSIGDVDAIIDDLLELQRDALDERWYG